MTSKTDLSEIPPGVDGDWVHNNSGGRDTFEWLPFTSRKLYTNVFVVDAENRRVLLGYKKRGFGDGMYNGFGGKVEPGETPIQGAQRELHEESGIHADIYHIGTLFFATAESEVVFHVDIYRANKWTGEPIETEEMRPHWFQVPVADPATPFQPVPGTEVGEYPEIPYKEMWDTDCFWLPLLLSDIPFHGRADFFKDENSKWQCGRWWYGVAPSHSSVQPPALEG